MPGQLISTEICLIWMIYFAPRASLSGAIPPRLSFRLQNARHPGLWAETDIYFLQNKTYMKAQQALRIPLCTHSLMCIPTKPPWGREGGWSRSRTSLWRFFTYTEALLSRLAKTCNFRLLYIAVGKSWIFYKASNPINKSIKLQWYKCGGALV